MTKPATMRCAIYTRKSSEEGLEQEFNSLDAQREACEAYIISQKHEGWKALLNRYDDGGFSGGNMERPGLKQLLVDISMRKVDVVVVYKVDRLTRALSDFAKIIEVFDKENVSFVSVTQQFNTTSSMGRLTLNVLLSFAQFEREVTGERIRDKIAASKAKGMWMGGLVPLGYEPIDKKLIINEAEAETVKHIYKRYLAVGSVAALKTELDRTGHKTKKRSQANSKHKGGSQFSRGALYGILKNKTYIGKIHHKGKVYDGEHQPIIDLTIWQKVQQQLQDNENSHFAGKKAGYELQDLQPQKRFNKNNAPTPLPPSLLTGLIYDSAGYRFTPVQAKKNGKHYRYYVSQSLLQYRADQKPQIGRIPAELVEKLVQKEMAAFLNTPTEIFSALNYAKANTRQKEAIKHKAIEIANKLSGSHLELHSADLLRRLIKRIEIYADKVCIRVCLMALKAALIAKDLVYKPADENEETSDKKESTHVITVNARILRCGLEKRIVYQDNSTSQEQTRHHDKLKEALIKGYKWRKRFMNDPDATMEIIAKENGLTTPYVGRIIELSFLAPDITASIIKGTLPAHITLDKIKGKIPLDWEAQRKIFA